MIENTTDRGPFIHLLGSMSDGASGYIEGMEAAGQRQLVESTSFPSKAPIADLEALGFTFGPVDDRDPMFRPATLPQGWKREGSDHSMWSYIVDDKGRQRVSIFYKAAFYDRDAFANIVRPTSRLSDLIYADKAPRNIELDDLLTAEMARDYLDEELANTQKALASYMAGDKQELAREERVKALLALLPPRGGDPS